MTDFLTILIHFEKDFCHIFEIFFRQIFRQIFVIFVIFFRQILTIKVKKSTVEILDRSDVSRTQIHIANYSSPFSREG